MLTAIFTIVIAIIFLIIYIEYKNEKRYQNERKKKREKESKTVLDTQSQIPGQTIQRNLSQQDPKISNNANKTADLSHSYPPFTHARLVDMGFSDKEARAFVAELIPQLETQIPLIKNAIDTSDFYQAEKLTHHIKGSATNIGTGGISDLLVEYNRYLKSGTDITIINAYFKDLIRYTDELKLQYT